MASLFRRSNGIWYIVYGQNQKRKWLSTGEVCYGRALHLFRTSTTTNQVRRRNTLTSLAEAIVAYSSTNFAPPTTALYRSSFARLVEIAGDKLVKLVSVRDGEEFKRIRAEKVSRVTVNKELRTLRAAFTLASELGYAESNPFKSVRQLRVANVEPKYLSIQEFKRLLSLIEGSDFRNLVEFTVLTMLRRSELINLTWEDVDLARQVIHIRNKSDFTVKGMKARVVPLNDRATQILNESSQRSCYVFAGPDGSRLNGGSLSRRFKKYVRKCGLPDEIHFHSLRHTGASWLVQQGVPLFAVQKILGHSSPNVTQIYSHLEDMHLHDAVSKLSVGNSATSSSIHPVIHLN